MTAPAFITRIESHRDPGYLWPLAGLGAILVHGGLWLVCRSLVITSQAAAPPQSASIPVQLWLDAPAEQSPQVANTEARPGALPAVSDQTSSSKGSPLPDAVAVHPDASQAKPVLPLADSPLSPSSAPLPRPQPEIAASSLPPASPVPSPDLAKPTPSPPVSPAANGQLLAVGLMASSFGTDFPDRPPQLLDRQPLVMQPWLSVCGLKNLGAIASPGLVAKVNLQVQVQPDGKVSRATVVDGTGDTALDQLVSCMVEQQVRLQPATTAGTPQLTDAYILQTQLRF